MAETKILLVEGVDDDAVIFRLFNHYGIGKGQIEIKKAGGVPTIFDELKVRIKNAEPEERIGAVLDADTDLAARWRSLQDIFNKAGYASIPSSPDPASRRLADA